jgi:hypothetical protein
MKTITVLKPGTSGRVTLRSATRVARLVKRGRAPGELPWQNGSDAKVLHDTYLGKIFVTPKRHASSAHQPKTRLALTRKAARSRATVVSKRAAKKK